MKKKSLIIIITFIFILGVAFCLYPTISTYINLKNESRVIENQIQAEENVDTEVLQAEKDAVMAYNKSLAVSHMVLTDPFDEDAFPITDGEYEELLTLSDSMASIEIPKLNINLPIYHGTDPETLEKGVGHLENTSLPLGGEGTHTVLSAHTGLPSQKLFSDIDKMEIGDIFYITVLGEKLSYQVDQIKIVEPDNPADLMIIEGQDYVTLVTCTPYGKNTHRLLVRGTRIENADAEEVLETQKQELSMLDKLLMNYGISLRELIVFAAIAIMTVAFVVIMIILIHSGKRKGKHVKRRS